MKFTTIKIEQHTLPNHDERVDFYVLGKEAELKTGHYLKDASLFWVNEGEFYNSFNVLKWKKVGLKIYVASSWRNEYQQNVVNTLRELGHKVYDFKNPPSRTGFSWSDIDPNWLSWTSEQYKEALNNPIAEEGFNSDFVGMMWADTCLMVLPCGRSANTEAGWMKGTGKSTYVFQPTKQEPELMYKIYDGIITSFEELHQTFKIN